MRVFARLALLAALAPAAAGGSGAIADDPLPLDKTVTLKDGSYSVTGRQTLPRNVSLTILRGLTVSGDKDAVLELEGSIKFKAPTGGRVVFDNVWLEVTPECREIILSHVEFRGGGIRAHESGPGKAKVFMESVQFTGSAAMNLEMSGGEVDIQGARSMQPMRIVGVPRSEKAGSTLDLMMLSCQPLSGGLHVQGAKTATVRNCNLGGSSSSFVDNVRLEFDGNTVKSRELAFRVSEFGGFGRTEIKNSDFLCKKLVLFCPAKGDRRERVTLHFSYFGGLLDEDRILEQLVHDGEDDPESGAVAGFKKIVPVPLGLGGK